jgi:TRAP-type C4-dicarboxylate transport system permease small subunit
MKALRRIADLCLKPIGWLSAVFLGTSAIVYAYNSVLRYVFKSAMPWPEEYCTYIVVLMLFLLQCRLEFYDEELAIGVLDNLTERYPVLKRVLFYFRCALTLVLFGILLNVCIAVTKTNFSYGVLSPVLRIPMGLYFLMTAVTFGLVMLFTLLNMISTRKFLIASQEKGGEKHG